MYPNDFLCGFTNVPSAKDVCELPAEIGEGQDYTSHWYYDTSYATCRQFYYGGFGGNGNRFATQDECTQRCKQAEAPKVEDRFGEDDQRQQQPSQERPREQQRPSEQERPREQQQPSEQEQPHQQHRPRPAANITTDRQACLLAEDAGTCRDPELRYRFNSDEGVCQAFTYGGCGGNANNFRELDECERLCRDAVDACSLPPAQGECEEFAERYYWDARSQACESFMFGGCGGNSNNFETAVQCEQQCRERQPEPEPAKSGKCAHKRLVLCNVV